MKVDIETNYPIVRETVKALGIMGDSASTAVAQFIADSMGWCEGEEEEDPVSKEQTIGRLVVELESLREAADFAIKKLQDRLPGDVFLTDVSDADADDLSFEYEEIWVAMEVPCQNTFEQKLLPNGWPIGNVFLDRDGENYHWTTFASPTPYAGDFDPTPYPTKEAALAALSFTWRKDARTDQG